MKNTLLLLAHYSLLLTKLGAIIFSFIANVSIIHAQDLQISESRYFCGRTRDNRPATLVNTLTGRIITIIIWEGRYSRDRCEFVSRRFEESYRRGSLKYLKSSYLNGYNVICSVEKYDEECTDTEQILIYLTPEECPDEIIKELTRSGTAARGPLTLDGNLHGDPTTDAPEPEEINSN